MPPSPSSDFLLPLLDWLSLLACLAGAFLGAAAGLPRAFGLLLWTLAALWLGHHLSAHVVDWMPNAVDPADPSSRAAVQLPAFLIIACIVLLLPLAGRILGGASGKKRAGDKGHHKPFGALTGLVVAALLVTLAMPFVRGLTWLGWARAAAPACAEVVASNAAWLFPAAHRDALREARDTEGAAGAPASHPAAASDPAH
ncbi:MAG TPA: CvpA family protein [Planctomycetota bacterium]|nr:CvpA family protein [Planctomycetota bacterium]